MILRSNILLLMLLSTAFLLSCNKDDKASGDTFPNELQAVWQEEMYDDGDELGLYFTSDKIGYWDYMGDEYDEGEDCYFAEEIAELISYEGNNYRILITDPFEDEEEEIVVVMEVDGDELTLTEEYEDEEYEEIYSKDSRSVNDLEPKCSFEGSSQQKQNTTQRLLGNK